MQRDDKIAISIIWFGWSGKISLELKNEIRRKTQPWEDIKGSVCECK